MIGYFGYGNCCIKKFTPQELNIALPLSGEQIFRIRRFATLSPLLYLLITRVLFTLKEPFQLLANSHYTIEYRQRYVWFLGIPFFPLRKYWCVRVDGKRQYYLPESIQKTVDALQIKKRAPFYTYTFTLLLFLAGAIVLFGTVIYPAWYKYSEKNGFIEREAKMKERLTTPKAGDFYVMHVSCDTASKGRSWYYYPFRVFKLEKVSGDSLGLIFPFKTYEEDGDAYENFPAKKPFSKIYKTYPQIGMRLTIHRKDAAKVLDNYNHREEAPLVDSLPWMKFVLYDIFREGEDEYDD